MADPNDIAAMEKLGLPTGFEFGNNTQGGRSLKTKKDKKTFYCNTCKLELNSEDTMKSHMKGSKHMKKALAEQAEGRDVLQVQLIANPKPTRKKQPTRLQEKIYDSAHNRGTFLNQRIHRLFRQRDGAVVRVSAICAR